MSENDTKHEPSPSHQLRVILDPTGHKMGQKLYESYVSRIGKSYGRFPEFMIALDRLISEFGGTPLPPDEEDEARPAKKDYGDEDLHEDTASVDEVKAAIRALLIRGK